MTPSLDGHAGPDHVVLHWSAPLPTTLRVHGFDAGLAVERLDGGDWERLEGDPGLVQLVGADGPTPSGLAPIVSTIPADVLAAAAPFPIHGLSLLRVMRTREGRQLVESAPTLAWLVAARLGDGVPPPSPLDEFVRAPRRELLGYALAGEPATASMVRAAARVEVPCYDHSALRTLRTSLREPVVLRLAARLGAWSVSDLELLRRFGDAAELRYASELFARARTVGLEALHDEATTRGDVMRMLARTGWRRSDIDARLAAMRSLAELERLHDRLAAALRTEAGARHLAALHASVTLPAPPLPGSPDIVPLLTPADFIAEGSEMRHCVASYVDSALLGECAVYRVLAPERATLEVGMRSGRLELRQLRGPRNRAVSAETHEAVRRWFHASVAAAAAARS